MIDFLNVCHTLKPLFFYVLFLHMKHTDNLQNAH